MADTSVCQHHLAMGDHLFESGDLNVDDFST